MIDPTREICEGLLRAMGHNTPNDVSQKHRAKAAKFRSCFRVDPNLDAFDIARKLDASSGTGLEACDLRGELIGLTKFPLQPLAWAWADIGAGPGQLDMTRASGSSTAVSTIAEWIKARPHGALVLSGPSGCGKTVAAVKLAISAKGKFFEAARFDEFDFSNREAMDDLLRSRLLIIDELGRESPHGKTPTRISEVIRARHDNGMPTIITTQLLDDSKDREVSFAKRYGGHLVDRIKRDGCWSPLDLPTRRGGGARPSLRGLLHSCRISRLHNLLTVSGTDIRVVHELRDLLGISQSAIEAGMAERAEELRDLDEQMARLKDSVHAEIVRRIVGLEAEQ